MIAVGLLIVHEWRTLPLKASGQHDGITARCQWWAHLCAHVCAALQMPAMLTAHKPAHCTPQHTISCAVSECGTAPAHCAQCHMVLGHQALHTLLESGGAETLLPALTVWEMLMYTAELKRPLRVGQRCPRNCVLLGAWLQSNVAAMPCPVAAHPENMHGVCQR